MPFIPLASYADEATTALLAKTSGAEPVISEHDIADLQGGVREPTYQKISSGGQLPHPAKHGRAAARA